MTPEEIIAVANQRLSQGVSPSKANPYVAQANEMLARRDAESLAAAAERVDLQASSPELAQAFDNPAELMTARRAAMSLPSDDAEKVKYLERQYGEENVREVERNGAKHLLFRPHSDQPWRFVDRPEFTLGDIADFAGPAIETIPTAIAGVATAPLGPAVAIPIAAGVSGLSNAVRQGVSAAATSETKPWMERAKDFAVSAALGAAGEGGARLATRLLTPAGKAKALAETAKRDFPKETAEGLALRNEFEIPLTLGQITKSQEALQKESLQRQVGSGADLAVKALRDRQNALTAAGEKLVDTISNGPVMSAPKAAKTLAVIRNSKLDGMRKETAAEAAALFDAVPPEVKINMAPTREMIDKLIEQNTGKLQTPAGEALVKTLSQWKSTMGDWMTAKELKIALEQFGEYGSTGDIMKDIGQKKGRKVGKAVLKSLYDSLDRAATQDVGTAEAQGAAAALKEARDNYREMMTAMEEADNYLLRKSALLKKQANPGAIIDSIARGRTFDPDDIAKTLAVADEVKPEFADQLRGVIVDRMLTPASGEQMSGGVISNKLLQKDNARMLDALFATKPEMRAKIARFAQVAQRSAMKPYREGSQTAPLMAALASAGPAPVAVPISLWTRSANLLTTSRAMTKLMQTDDGINILFDLSKPQETWMLKGAKAGGAAISRLLLRAAELAGEDEVNP